ncbi:ABC transporter ATP-binding protein [Clostridia bacterium]|nr:ABC transporter ATP-binding protein [Clostridia bacterium]
MCKTNKIISIQNLVFSYEEELIFKRIDVTVFRNEILCIKGRNGSGKTTLLKLLAGILSGEEGSLRIFEGKSLFFVPSSPYLYEKLTGRENVSLIKQLWNADESYDQKAEHFYEVFDMAGYVDNLVETYSLGMKYKVFLVAALSLNCDLLLMDEPLNAMDVQGQDLAIELLKEYCASTDKTIVFSSHIRDLVNTLATREIELNHGVIAKGGKVDE